MTDETLQSIVREALESGYSLEQIRELVEEAFNNWLES